MTSACTFKKDPAELIAYGTGASSFQSTVHLAPARVFHHCFVDSAMCQDTRPALTPSTPSLAHMRINQTPYTNTWLAV